MAHYDRAYRYEDPSVLLALEVLEEKRRKDKEEKRKKKKSKFPKFNFTFWETFGLMMLFGPIVGKAYPILLDVTTNYVQNFLNGLH